VAVPVVADVVVVGAGVIGLSAAVRCAEAGLQVVLVDPAPGRGASWAAAGMLAPVTELHYGQEPLLRLNLAAAARWPSWAASLAERGADVGFVRCGSLLVARDADDAAELRRLHAAQVALGLEVRWLGSRDVRAAEPALAPSVRGGIAVPGDHQVDNRALVDGLLGGCRADPRVRLVADRVVRLRLRGGAVAGVEMADGSAVAAPVVALAAGAGSGGVEGLPPLPAVRPVKGQLLHLRCPGPPLATRNLRGTDVYLVSRPDGRLVVGATVEERGFDTTVTAGGVHQLLRAAWELLPGVDECAFVEATCGLRPGSPDDAPLLGPVDALDGLLLATGHHRNGVLQSALTADAVAAWATGSDPPPAVLPFSPSRFAQP
jgi:glycine oxidase